ncbi:hypothetical protein BDP55DRAFT_681217 [Colletotrichum godetiae]|uniref:Uncharacterized protein n=1 Tax=Colletotrichum godetiae TaxID=1209918 RepID=A0AAJ0A9A8_9PEZI|nr:uncharacterized protein BDP55DRAFT_681217 [Colletotrichum godetiae]KAK1658914.1 hypothetical protein BDP55DRAFT_681217 [Colletotrichum godetiae]
MSTYGVDGSPINGKAQTLSILKATRMLHPVFPSYPHFRSWCSRFGGVAWGPVAGPL